MFVRLISLDLDFLGFGSLILGFAFPDLLNAIGNCAICSRISRDSSF